MRTNNISKRSSRLNEKHLQIFFLFTCQKHSKKTICFSSPNCAKHSKIVKEKTFCFLSLQTSSNAEVAMSFNILSDQNTVWQRKIVYQTFNEIFVVFVKQKKKTNEKEENWTTVENFMISKIFINFIATLQDQEENEDCSRTFIFLGGFVPPLSVKHLLYPYDIVTLPKETRTIQYKYDCDCVPFFENQSGVVWTSNDLTGLLGHPHSPVTKTRMCFNANFLS